MRVAVLTVSDRAAEGSYEDRTGPRIIETLAHHFPDANIVAREIVADEHAAIAERLRTWCDEGSVDLVVTNGGTGLSPRDVTPEATMDVVDRTVPGIAEVMRTVGRGSTPLADLSRQVAGQRRRTLIVNLPGSPTAAVESLEAITALLPHAVELIRRPA